MRDSPWAPHYEAVAERISELYVNGLNTGLPVPACPGWTTRDLLAHLAGLTHDWVAGELEPYASSEWTAAQVARFSPRPVPELLSAWRESRRSFLELPESANMGDPALWALGDALVHEADLHEALGDGTRPPTESVQQALKFGIARWRAHLAAQGVTSVLIDVVDARAYWCGEPNDAAPVLRADAWEISRVLWGRRTGRQVRQLVEHGSADRLIEAGLPYPFAWSDADPAG